MQEVTLDEVERLAENAREELWDEATVLGVSQNCTCTGLLASMKRLFLTITLTSLVMVELWYLLLALLRL